MKPGAKHAQAPSAAPFRLLKFQPPPAAPAREPTLQVAAGNLNYLHEALDDVSWRDINRLLSRIADKMRGIGPGY
jgi:hypothetical protein